MPPSVPTRTLTPALPAPSTLLLKATAIPYVLQDITISQTATVSTPSNCCHDSADAVLLDLYTTIVIPNYHLYYSAPISSFRPHYHALGDGSLVAPPLIADLRSANVELSLMSALGMFFLVTTTLSLQYLRRGKIKKKVLFYILFVSQLLGLASIITMVVPFFNQFVSCTSVGFVVITGAMTSYSLLMTGILGIKAYRCLNNSRLVLLVLAILRTAMIILFILDLTAFKSERRLSGSCMPEMNLEIMPVLIILQAVESAFICSCFLFAVWQASRTSVEQGRMSINLSLDGKGSNLAIDKDSNSENGQVRRGWWDYVPEEPRPQQPPTRRSTGSSRSVPEPSGIIHFVGSKLHDLWSYPPPDGPSVQRKPSPPRESHVSQPPRTSIAFTNIARQDNRAMSRQPLRHLRSQGPPPPSPSAMSRLSKYMPRMQLFKRVLKNELYYTAFVTVIYVILAVLMLVGMSCKFAMNPVGWAAVSWFTVSLFTMHSLGRVVRRHEREAILQHPTAWDPVYRAELEASRVFHKGRLTGRTYSPVSVASRRPRRTAPLDPFEDPRLKGLQEGTDSLAVPDAYSGDNAGRPPELRPWAIASRDFSVSSGSYEDSVDDQPDRLYTQWGGAEVLPSPAPSDCPAPKSATTCACNQETDLDARQDGVQRPVPTNISVRSSRRSSSSLHSRTS